MTIRNLASITLLALAGCSSPPPPPTQKAEKPAAPAEPAVKISLFYPEAAEIGRGQKTQLCYGVEGAKKVSIKPPVDEVWPSLSRCFEVKPVATTTYTLTAEDAAGHSVSKDATIKIGARKPESQAASASTSRMIQEVNVNKLAVAAGEEVTVCYTAKNAASVKITPGEGAGTQSAQRGCITDHPSKTTTYQVVATGPAGQSDSEKVVVKVH